MCRLWAFGLDPRTFCVKHYYPSRILRMKASITLLIWPLIVKPLLKWLMEMNKQVYLDPHMVLFWSIVPLCNNLGDNL